MKKSLCLLAAAAILCLPSALAQTPAGSTGQCKDGSYTSAAKKDGACRGHKGVQTWFAASAAPAPATTAAAPAPKAAPASKATPAPAPAPATTAAAPAPKAAPAPAAAAAPTTRRSPAAEAASRTQAPGGGPGLVWVNTPTKVYHCSGSEFYGKTKEGKYMSEADAKSMGAHADHNKPCSQ